MDNYLEFFKESTDNPKFAEHKGQGKIFMHHLCADAAVPRKCYGMRTINEAYVGGHNKEHFLGKVTSMIHALQEALDQGLHTTPLGKYPHAEKDYPPLYETIVREISDDALKAMAAHKQDFGCSVYPENLGEQVAERLRRDKAQLRETGELRHIKTFVGGGRSMGSRTTLPSNS